MAIVKANYTKKAGAAKASIRYIEHRPGKDTARITRTLFGIEGKIERSEAYRLIDEAKEGSIFFRFVISPDPKAEDTEKDLYLREVVETTMQTLEDRLHKHVPWVAAEHNDHAPHRHMHVIAVVPGRLDGQHFSLMRKAATEASLEQRRELDLVREHRQREREQEEAQWELQR